MDWMKLSANIPCLSLIPLGTLYKDNYYFSDECNIYLEKIIDNLNCEDPNMFPVRRTLGFLDILNKDLIPILINSKDRPGVFSPLIRLLAGLSEPIESLISVDILSTSSVSQHVVIELTRLLYNIKEAFLNPKANRAILDQLQCFLCQQTFSPDDINCINSSLLLLHNILNAPERPPNNMEDNETTSSSVESDVKKTEMSENSHTLCFRVECSQQNRLLWNLFSQGIDRVLLSLLSHSRKEEWVVTIAQLIPLFYKERVDLNKDAQINVSALELSENNAGKDLYSPVSCNVSLKLKEQRKTTLNNCGLMILNYPNKTLANNQQMPSEGDISDLLKEFAVAFLRNGYNTLVGQLYQLLTQQDSNPQEKSPFLWLIAYFLRFNSSLKLDVEHFKDIFTVDLLCYLTYEAVRETEEFEINLSQPSLALKSCMDRLHLSVAAIQEYLKTLETYYGIGRTKNGKTVQSQEWEERISLVCNCLPAIRDLRQLFLFQLRLFNPVIQSQQYIHKVITANHILLLLLERVAVAGQSPYGTSFDLHKHLNQFCSPTILSRYGTALKDFKTNDPFINDCIMTVLHHIGIDLGRIDLLCDPTILRPFSEIWEEGFKVRDDWDDLIAYVAQKFLRIFRTHVGRDGTGFPDRCLKQSYDTWKEEGFDERFLELEVPSDEIALLRNRLMISGYHEQLKWIQSSLLTACSARLGTYTGKEFCNPVVCLSLKLNVSCPVVPWTESEASALRSGLFRILLQRIGLILPVNNFVLYPRIPRKWSADEVYSVALIFGPVGQKQVDFDLARVNKVKLPIEG